ncbi:cupin domain-containing protein [Pseudomonas sp. 148P]|uniref:Cupin domain-containing protein n=1 Tax=Pseudomonas ulcerans TaxID=3115852 RepID=A0ABU7HQM0_9PSED|nr:MULTISPECIES: cupin domain-containing protein [unclassified Pseudomonas]MEE1923774.1 cupin domain-containing protein [Pseudomonas sp. 147P]MEE1933834.1 cupin domain-containing protein [Pseudomonas sp. 148P]
MSADFIGGLDARDFLANTYGKKPAVFRGSLNSTLIGPAEMNDLFLQADCSNDDFKLAFGGRLVEKADYVERYVHLGVERSRLKKHAVYDFLSKGATVIVNRIERCDKVARLEQEISKLTGHRSLTSGYLAYRSMDSFKSHWDTRDIFVFQFSGRKRWVINEPTFRDPLYMQQSKDFEAVFSPPDNVYMDVTLEPGDMLYVPRGWWHNPSPVGEKTFHLTVGTYPPTGLDYVNWLMILLPQVESVRRSLDNWEADKETVKDIAAALGNLAASPSSYEQFMKSHHHKWGVQGRLSFDLMMDDDQPVSPLAMLDVSPCLVVNSRTETATINDCTLSVAGTPGVVLGYLSSGVARSMEDIYQLLAPAGRSELSRVVRELVRHEAVYVR